jgi:predicted amidohydrolase
MTPDCRWNIYKIVDRERNGLHMENTQRLKVGALQFAAGESIESNLAAIKRGIKRAGAENVRLLLTQECALCGYPPVEVPSVQAIDRTCQREAYQEISKLTNAVSTHLSHRHGW